MRPSVLRCRTTRFPSSPACTYTRTGAPRVSTLASRHTRTTSAPATAGGRAGLEDSALTPGAPVRVDVPAREEGRRVRRHPVTDGRLAAHFPQNPAAHA